MKHLSPRMQGLIAINAAAVIFGSAALYGKLDVSPFWISFLRAAFGAATILILGVYKKDIRLPPRNLRLAVIVTGILLGLHWLTFFVSVQISGIAIATLTFAAFPLFTVLIEAFHQRRKPYAAEIATGLTIIVAVGLLVSPRNGPSIIAGALAGLMSGLVYALFWHAGKRLSEEMPPRSVSFWQSLVTAAILLPFLPFSPPMPGQPMDWLWLALLGIVNTAILLQIYLYALQRISPSTCSGFVALEPVYAIIFAALFFHEPITTWTILSAALIIGASVILMRLETANSQQPPITP